MTEPTYTLDEARRELARQECQNFGHDWNIIQNVAGVPFALTCDRCGTSCGVVANPDAKEGGK